ncbi:hypothetical protein WKY82_16120 [Gordonia malaquae]|uniref:hypothetical protein n=1 Tax=Gordonia malaquae TaxID=410332 RepID=UPI0030C7948C
MSMRIPKPQATVGIAVFVTLVAFAVAAIADTLLVRLFAVVLGAVAAIVLVRSAGRRSTRAGAAGVFLVPVVMLGLGTTVVGALTDGSGTPSYQESADDTTARADLVEDPNARLRAAFDKADELVPGGSGHVQLIDLDEDSTRVVVLDPNTGQQVTANESSSGWSDPTRDSASDRNTFGRADTARLDLSSAQKKVGDAARRMKIDLSERNSSDGIEISQRYQDKKLIATFTVGGSEIEVDMAGGLPDTLDAGSFDTVVDSMTRVMTTNGLDPRKRTLSDADFKSSLETAYFPGAGSVGHYGGFVLSFDSGPVARIEVVPGAFPVVTSAESDSRPSSGAFALSAVTMKLLTTIRDDVVERFHAPAYDRQAVGFEIERERDDTLDEYVPLITLSVGPSSAEAQAVYTLRGVEVPKN